MTGMGMTKVFGQNGKLLPGAGDHIRKLSGGGSLMPQQQPTAPVQGNAQKAATYTQAPKQEAQAWQKAVSQSGLGQQTGGQKAAPYAAYAPQPQMSTTYAQPGGGWGHQPTAPQQTYGQPQGNYANAQPQFRPPPFQESVTGPFGQTMSPQDFYAQRDAFMGNVFNQQAQFAQNAGVFGQADLPQNSMPQWGDPSSMWPQQQSPLGGLLAPGSQAPQGGPNMPGVYNPMYTMAPDPAADIRQLMGQPDPRAVQTSGGVRAYGDPSDPTAQQPISLPPPKPAKSRPAARPTTSPEVERASRIAAAQMKYGRPLTTAEVASAKSGAKPVEKPSASQVKAQQSKMKSMLGYTVTPDQLGQYGGYFKAWGMG